MYLVITVVKKGWGDVVLSAMAKIGVVGGTILPGHGKSRNQGLLGMALSPEKEVILTAVGADLANEAMRVAIEAGELHSAGVGICMSVPLTSLFRAPSPNDKTVERSTPGGRLDDDVPEFTSNEPLRK
jgi:hypothetical protein